MPKAHQFNRKYAQPKSKWRFFPPFFIVGGAAILLAVMLIFSNPSSPTPAAPEVTGTARLRADKQKIDLGDVKLGTTVKASFQLTNVGDQTLRLTKAPYVELIEGC